MSTIKPTMFISYNYGRSFDLANSYSEHYTQKGVDVSFDKNKVGYGDDWDKYMALISDKDLVLLIVCDEFLKSNKCMYEASLLMQVPNWHDKTRVVLLDDVFDISDLVKYINYWEDKVTQETIVLSRIKNEEARAKCEDSLRYSRASLDSIPKFIRYIQKHKILRKDVVFSVIDELVKEVRKKINETTGSTNNPEKNSTKMKTPPIPANVLAIDKGIDDIDDSELQKIIMNISSAQQDTELPLCVIYTGGSAGEIRNPHKSVPKYIQAELHELINRLPNIAQMACKIHFYKFARPFNSANIKSEHWVEIAKIINKLYQYYKGFVVIHGAHTMAHTATALSFMFNNLDKPIILTGSELPLDAEKTDATSNIMRALSVATTYKNDISNNCESCILYGRLLIRGNRAVKNRVIDLNEGFYSPNYCEIGEIRGEKVVKNPGFVPLEGAGAYEYNGYMTLNENIIVVDVNPNLSFEMIERLCKNSKPSAIILRTYGLGELPKEDEKMWEVLSDYINKDGIVVSILKNPLGHNNYGMMRLDDFSDIFDAGVVIGGDMTTEAAYCKLMHLLGKYPNKRNVLAVKAEMTVNLCGELSTSIHIASVNNKEIIKSDSAQSITDFKFISPFDINSIYSMTIRIKGLRITEGFNDSFLHLCFEFGEGSKSILVEHSETFGEINKPFSFNVDVPLDAQQFLETKKEFSIKMLSPDYTIKFDSISIVVFRKN